jgi:hypothetical protein
MEGEPIINTPQEAFNTFNRSGDGYSCSGELRDRKVCVAAEHVKRSYAVFEDLPVVRASLASSFRPFGTISGG